MPTLRETILAALHARLQPLAALTLRDEIQPEKIPPVGLIILRDGQPGEPEVTLSPLRCHYQHRAELEVVVQAPNGRASLFDTLIASIGPPCLKPTARSAVCFGVQNCPPSGFISQALRFVFQMIYPIIPLYFVLLILYGTLRDEVPSTYWVLLGNYTEWVAGSLLNVFWFVSLYAQIVLVLAVIIAVRPLRQAVVAAPWHLAVASGGVLILLLAGVALFGPRTAEGIIDLPYYPQRGLPECLSVFVLGWMLRLMQSRTQVAITLAIAEITVTLWARIDMTLQVAGFLSFKLAMLAFAPRVTMRRFLAGWINRLAAATLFVYCCTGRCCS